MAKRSSDAAAEPVVGRKQIVPISVDQFDVDLFVPRQRGEKDGLPCFYASYNHSQLAINLTPEKETWFNLPFGAGNRVAPAEDEKVSTMPVCIEVAEEVGHKLVVVENIVKDAVLLAVPGATWSPSLSRNNELYDPVLRAKLVLNASREEQLTACRVKQHGKPAVKVAGEEELRPLLKANYYFRHAKVKAAVVLRHVWVMKGENGSKVAGMTWHVTSMMVNVPQPTVAMFEDVFADEVFPDEA